MNQKELLTLFRKYLTERGLMPGDKLPGELELAEHFGVSRGTIREIVIHLGFLGILERSPKRGTFIKTPDFKDIGETLAFQLKVAGYGFEELKATRLFLETSQAELMVKLITPQMLDHLNSLTDRMENATANSTEADKLDLQFHLTLMEITGNRVLGIFAQVMILMFDEKYRVKFLNPEAAKKSVMDHRAILKAISSGNAADLTGIIRKHIQPL